MVATAECTAMPTSTQITVHTATTRSLTSCASSRAGVVAYGTYLELMPSIPAQIDR